MANGGFEVTIEVAKETWNFLMGKRSLANNMDNNFAMMITAAEKLQAKMEDNELTVQQNRTKTTTKVYKTWLSNVTRTLEKVEMLRADYDGERSSHLLRRSDYSDKVTNICQKVDRLVEEGEFPGGFLIDKPPEAIVKLRAPQLEGFPTHQRALQDTIQLLRNDKLKGISILGTVGVGKTTIMKNLNNHEEVAKMFDIVIWLNVSKDRTYEKLQLDIAQRLKLKTERATCSAELAGIISAELKGKKYLLLLDEVMQSIDLVQIGIPDSNGSKVVLTTQFRHVCSSMTDRMVKVDRLSPDEAWRMFQDIAGDKIDLPDVEPIARLVVDECDRLPLVIRTVASSFNMKDSDSEWRNGLRELEKWPEIEIPGLSNMHVFLKFCYDELKDEKIKNCFLYGALYPIGSKIYVDYLVECWVAEGLLGAVDDRLRFRDKRDEGYGILGHLVNVSLLEKDDRMVYVQVNNSVRQVALYISSQETDCRLIAPKGEHSPYPPNLIDWEQAKRISLIKGKLHDLPESPKCNKLLSLLLRENPNLNCVPASFFKNMQMLLVLDLFRTGIVSLPISVSKLTTLKALFLNDCPNITELPPQVAELLLLEVLDIRGCKIPFISPHIGKLVYLRCLRMSYLKRRKTQGMEIDCKCNVISRLARLEELMIDVASYDHWCIDVANVICEVASLENLTTLRICFPKPEILKLLMEKKLSWRDRKQLTSFWYFVGCQNENNPPILKYLEYKVNRYMRYCYSGHNDSTIPDVLPNTDALELIGQKNIKCLSDFMNFSSLSHLRGCLIERCNKIITIVNGQEAERIDILPILEQMHLRSLLNLKSIFEGPFSGKSLSKLHTIVVKSCPMLSKIFTSGAIRQLSKLKKLSIESCFEIQVLIENSGVVSHDLPSLEILELVDMPKLGALCTDESLKWPSLKELKIFGCPQVKSLPFGDMNAPELKVIEGEQIWWVTLQWQNSEVREHLQALCSIR